jgi:nitroimidazol reductase NimA-like FMN-containing flavoprotein (pyridoxamine 5'-phosphate oxidase superfamily)
MRLGDVNSGLEMLDREECLRRLATQEIGRLAFVIAGHPDVLPVNYTLDGDAVVIRSDSGRKLEGMSRSAVAFEVDEIDRARHAGWSVVVHGMAQEVTPYDRQDVVRRMADLPLHPWAGEKTHTVRITPTSISGRRIRPRPLD